MTMVWNDSLATGSSEIDAQHRELIARVNSLLGALDAGRGTEGEVSRLVLYLAEYVKEHFGKEEAFMSKYGYSSASAHRAQHELFMKNFDRIRSSLLTGGVAAQAVSELRGLCVDWLVNHIKYSDRALGMFLKMKL